MNPAADPRGARTSLAFGAILAALLVARLGFAALVYARPELAIANDTDRYVPIATNILSGTAYRWDTDRPAELLNTIGYPLFLAGTFGTIGNGAGDVALAQLVITGVFSFVVFLVLSRRFGPLPAFLSGMILALDPLSILWSMTVLTETLFAVMLGLGALMLWAWANSRSRTHLLLAGLFSGLACMVKPFALLVVGLWTVAIFLFPRTSKASLASRLAAGFGAAMLFALPTILLVTPWFIRNAELWNCPTLSSVDRVTMRDYMGAKVLSEVEHIDLETAQRMLQATDPGNCPRNTAKYWRIVWDNPGVYLRLHAAGTVPVLIATNFDRWLQYFGTDYVTPDLWRPYMDKGPSGLIAVLAEQVREFPAELTVMFGLTLFQLALYGLALKGATTAFRSYPPVDIWIVLLLLGGILMLVLTPGQGGHERFRVPVEPMLALLSAYAVAGRENDRKFGSRPVVPAGNQGATVG